MDEYIAATERVWDHLTRFSGISVGDLDPTNSPHRLHTYKSTFLKLRALLDGGAVIVGHGLRKDARELGVCIPPAQSGDTLRLWHLPNNRFLSLRFLASFLLGEDIQGMVHDSGEDAFVALRLYETWWKIKEAHGIEGCKACLNALYQVGRNTGWRAASTTSGMGEAGGKHASACAAYTALAGVGLTPAILTTLGLPSSSA